MIDNILRILLNIFPRRLKIKLFNKIYRYQIAEDCKLGLVFLAAKHVKMEPGATIGHFSVIKGLSDLEIGRNASIGRMNWITGFPLNSNSPHFKEEADRYPSLKLGHEAAITNRHIIDCTNRVQIGDFATFAGFRSQILTHSIDIRRGKQVSKPVSIGSYSFVGTASILLPGAKLAAYSVLAAGSVLKAEIESTHVLVGGVPAKVISELDANYAYFVRETGYVN